MPEFAKELARKNPEQVAIRDDKESLTWDDVDGILNRAVNRLLETDLGPQRRISVFAENSNQTALAHLAGLLAGASTVPVNFHLTAEEAAYILQDSETSVLFLGPETVERGLEAAQIAGIQKVIAWSDKKEPYSDFEIWNSWYEEASSEDPITNLKPLPHLLYTSGTTGNPKAGVISNSNVISSIEHLPEMLDISQNDLTVAYLPLAHIAERLLGHFLKLVYGNQTAFAESIEDMPNNVRQVGPSIFFGTPRVFEKFYAKIATAISDATSFQKKIYHWAISIGKEISISDGSNSFFLKSKGWLAKFLIYNKK